MSGLGLYLGSIAFSLIVSCIANVVSRPLKTHANTLRATYIHRDKQTDRIYELQTRIHTEHTYTYTLNADTNMRYVTVKFVRFYCTLFLACRILVVADYP